MADQEEIVQEPAIRDRTRQPSGVLPKNLKPYLYGGAVILLIVATLISGHTKPAGGNKPAKDIPPQPLIQDQTAGNVAEMRNELAQEKQKEAQDAALAQSLASQNSAQQGAILGYGADGRPIRGTVPTQGEPPPPANTAPDPAQQAAIQLEADEKKRIDNARFASNLVFTRGQEPTPQTQRPAAAPPAPAPPPPPPPPRPPRPAPPRRDTRNRLQEAGRGQSQHRDRPALRPLRRPHPRHDPDESPRWRRGRPGQGAGFQSCLLTRPSACPHTGRNSCAW